nr:hypothetical protein [Mesorhizobium escarrei]
MSRQQISAAARCAYATGIRARALRSHVAFVAQVAGGRQAAARLAKPQAFG